MCRVFCQFPLTPAPIELGNSPLTDGEPEALGRHDLPGSTRHYKVEQNGNLV